MSPMGIMSPMSPMGKNTQNITKPAERSEERKPLSGVPLISRGRKPPGKRLGWKFTARKRGMYLRRPRRRLWKRAEPAPAPRQRRDRIPPSEARRKESDESKNAERSEAERKPRSGVPLISRG